MSETLELERDYRGPTLSVTVSREGARIHRLIDDVTYPLRASKAAIRRDPMVEALFGVAPVTEPEVPTRRQGKIPVRRILVR
jgi:hypothetical protein